MFPSRCSFPFTFEQLGRRWQQTAERSIMIEHLHYMCIFRIVVRNGRIDFLKDSLGLKTPYFKTPLQAGVVNNNSEMASKFNGMILLMKIKTDSDGME
jgi:hypothetical protein